MRRAKGFTLDVKGEVTRDPVKVANALTNHFADNCSLRFIKRNDVSAEAIRNISIPKDGPNDFIHVPFSTTELAFA